MPTFTFLCAWLLSLCGTAIADASCAKPQPFPDGWTLSADPRAAGFDPVQLCF